MLHIVSLLFLSRLFCSDLYLQKRSFGVSSDPGYADGQDFDYIVIGAGLAGTTIAGRLSEDPSKTVLLIEAGNDDRTDPVITDILNFGAIRGSDLEWRWEADLGRFLRGGRTLGGTSSINNGIWTRGMRQQYDALSQFLSEEDGEMNWNFDSLFYYMKKAETFHPPDNAQRAKGADFIPEYHGFSGPVHSAFAQGMYGGPQQPAFVNAMRDITGIGLCPDINGGEANCVAYSPHSINPQADGNRSSSAVAYLSPVENERTNWLTLVGHRVTKVLLDGEAPKVTATGVQFRKSDGTGRIFNANARLEVIISSGTIGTPQVLQISGIGDPDVLGALDIPLKINLTTVGRNLQVRAGNTVAHSLNPSFDPAGSGPDNVFALPSIRELFAHNAGSNGSVSADEIAEYIMAMYPTWAQSQATNALSSDALTTIFGIQVDLLVNSNVPIVELMFNTAYPDNINILAIGQAYFSRGNVTITSSDIFTAPKVTVNWFDVDFDLAVQTAAVRLSRKLLDHASFDGISTGEITPGTAVVPNGKDGGTDAAWQAWIRDNFVTVNHLIGTAAMMRRELGGVVDGKLRVYDTKNLRVVDASILPLHFAVAPQSSLYGIAEKAADIIKAGL